MMPSMISGSGFRNVELEPAGEHVQRVGKLLRLHARRQGEGTGEGVHAEFHAVVDVLDRFCQAFLPYLHRFVDLDCQQVQRG